MDVEQLDRDSTRDVPARRRWNKAAAGPPVEPPHNSLFLPEGVSDRHEQRMPGKPANNGLEANDRVAQSIHEHEGMPTTGVLATGRYPRHRSDAVKQHAKLFRGHLKNPRRVIIPVVVSGSPE